MNIFRLGEFPSVSTIEGMTEEMSVAEQENVETLFGEGEQLDLNTVSELLTSIDKVYRQHMIDFRGETKPRFGSKDKDHQKAMENYKTAVMNIVNTWQKKYESTKKKKYGSLAARVTFAMRYNEDRLMGRPLLTISYIESID